MNEYHVTIVENGQQRSLNLMAASAAQARAQAEDHSDGEVIAVRFLRAVSFSCAIGDGSGAR